MLINVSEPVDPDEFAAAVQARKTPDRIANEILRGHSGHDRLYAAIVAALENERWTQTDLRAQIEARRKRWTNS